MLKPTGKPGRCFVSNEMIRVIRADLKFDSSEDLQEKLIGKLNTEFDEDTVKQTLGEKHINVTCNYKNCPLRLTYAYVKDSEGQLKELALSKM